MMSNKLDTLNTKKMSVSNVSDDWDTPLDEQPVQENIPASLPIVSNAVFKSSNRFEDMGIKESILRGLFSGGYDSPSPCQQAIPASLPNPETGILRDVILAARAGSGKTIYFGVVALNCVENNIKKLQAIIIAPTRELASQTFNVLCEIGKYTDISIALHRGVNVNNKGRGPPTQSYTTNLSRSESYSSFGIAEPGKEQVIIATPGKLLHILSGDHIRLSQSIVIDRIDTRYTRLVIMDEADELLSPKNEFQETIQNIFSCIVTFKFCQKLIVSATITDPVLNICSYFLEDPLQLLIKNEEVNISAISQYYVALEKEEDKAECLLDIYSHASIGTSIIFANKALKAEYLYDLMKENGFSVGYIHSKLNMNERDKIMKDFRNGSIRVLIATDLIARGIDVQSVSAVFNYDLPSSTENYIHRVGRCGRYGRVGVSVNLIVVDSRKSAKPQDIQALERYYNLEIKELPNLEVFKI